MDTNDTPPAPPGPAAETRRPRQTTDRGEAVRSLPELVAAAGDGSPTAWAELVRRHDRLVRWAARRHGLSGHDVDEVTQATFLKLVQHIGRITSPECLPSWLVTTARNEANRHLRSKARLPEPMDASMLQRHDPAEGSRDDPDRAVLEKERAGAVRGALRRLPPDRRRLLTTLVDDPSLGYRAVSDRLGMPIGSIGPTRGRSLATLRRCPELVALQG